MSEKIGYSGEAEGFKNTQEREEFAALCDTFNDDVSTEESENTVYFYTDGSRGGGMSCEEILREHFEEWLEAHPHVSFTSNATYYEHAPTETEYVREGKKED